MPLILLLLLLLSACGFSPLYGKNAADPDVASALSRVAVEAPKTRDGQVFSRELLSLLRGAPEQPADPLYRLKVTLEDEEIPLGIQQNRTVTRYRSHIDSRYALTEAGKDAPAETGALTATGGYDKVDSDYATYVSKRDVHHRALLALAEDYRQMLVNLVQERNQEEGAP